MKPLLTFARLTNAGQGASSKTSQSGNEAANAAQESARLDGASQAELDLGHCVLNPRRDSLQRNIHHLRRTLGAFRKKHPRRALTDDTPSINQIYYKDASGASLSHAPLVEVPESLAVPDMLAPESGQNGKKHASVA